MPPGCLDRLLHCISEAGGGNDVHVAFRQGFDPKRRIVTFKSHHNWHVHSNILDGADDPLCDDIAAHNPAEDVDQDGFDVLVRENDLESLTNGLLGRTTAHIEEVGRLPPMQLDKIHRAHR